jgi:hypothetical protein
MTGPTIARSVRRKPRVPNDLVVCEHHIVPQDCPYCELVRLRKQLSEVAMIEPIVVTCKKCDGTGVVYAENNQDHSEALKFVREMSIQLCPHWCANDCLACRTKAWLHEAGKT